MKARALAIKHIACEDVLFEGITKLYLRFKLSYTVSTRLRRGDIMSEQKIKAYTLSTCPYCRAFKMFMAEKGIGFEYKDVDLLEGEERDSVMDEVDKICPNCGYPIIVCGDQVIEGFNEGKLRKVLKL